MVGGGRCPIRTTHSDAISARKAASSRASGSSRFGNGPTEAASHCRAEVPIGVCDHCASKHWNQDAEAIVEEVVRCEYEKLPRRAAMRTDGDPQRE